MGQRFPGALTKADLFNTAGLAAGGASIALLANQFNKLGERIIQAGERIEIGFGALSGMDNAVGRINIKMMDTAGTPVEIKGLIRLTALTPQNRFLETVFELRSEQANANSTDRTKWRPLPEQNVVLTEDKKFVLEFWPDAAATLSRANSEVLIDVTIDEQ
jgi:hypothetical protein